MPPTTMRRRRFVHLMALTAAAAAGTGLARPAKAAGASSAPSPTRKREPAQGPERDRLTPAMRREIENQKKTLATSIRAIRDYPLPAGSDPAFVFQVRGRSGGASPGRTRTRARDKSQGGR